VVPKAVDGIDAIAKASTDDLSALIATPEAEANVTLFLPRFAIDAHCELREPLIDLGMGPAFDPTTTDFATMVTAHDGAAVPLYISQVIQACRIQVDEAGTTAAAASAVTMPAGCAMPPQPPKISATVRADHPFLIALSERRTNLVLMLARVDRPATSH
jgi:serpin B